MSGQMKAQNTWAKSPQLHVSLWIQRQAPPSQVKRALKAESMYIRQNNLQKELIRSWFQQPKQCRNLSVQPCQSIDIHTMNSLHRMVFFSPKVFNFSISLSFFFGSTRRKWRMGLEMYPARLMKFPSQHNFSWDQKGHIYNAIKVPTCSKLHACTNVSPNYVMSPRMQLNGTPN